IAAFPYGLAVVDRLQHCQPPRMFLHLPPQRIQIFRARVWPERLPALQRRPRRLHRGIYIGRASLRHLRELLSRRWISGLEILPFLGSLPVAANEMPEAPLIPFEPLQRFLWVFGCRPVFHRLEFLYDTHLFSLPDLPSRHPAGFVGRGFSRDLSTRHFFLHPLFSIFSRHAPGRFTMNFNRSRPHFDRLP